MIPGITATKGTRKEAEEQGRIKLGQEKSSMTAGKDGHDISSSLGPEDGTVTTSKGGASEEHLHRTVDLECLVGAGHETKPLIPGAKYGRVSSQLQLVETPTSELAALLWLEPI